jgi:hypothetical protein
MSIVYWSVSHEATYYHVIPEFAAILGWSTPLLYVPFYLMNLAVSLAGGLAWYEAEKRASARGKPWWHHVWFRRTYHLFGAVVSLVMMGPAIEFISDITGLSEWSQTHGPYIILNEATGPGIIASILLILFFIGLCMVLMYRAFTLDADSEIPV